MRQAEASVETEYWSVGTEKVFKASESLELNKVN
jgi:hypothetical protein